MASYRPGEERKKETKGPPVPPLRFIHSDPLKIQAGPNLKQFKIHGDLLAELSGKMRQLVYKDLGGGFEKREDYTKMRGVSEETMEYFSEFCYTGDYNVRLKPDATNRRTGDAVDREQALAHVRLYAFAKRYGVEALQELAVDNLVQFMANRNIDRTSVIPCLVEYAIENIPEEPTTDRLLDFLARGTASMIPPNGDICESVRSVLATVSRGDFFATFCKNVMYTGSLHTPRPTAAPWP